MLSTLKVSRNFSFLKFLLIVSPFLLWLLILKGFFLNRLSLINDAMVYYEHTKFYLDQITHGVYPLWDPTRDFGVPNEFYLRRIGNFNPLLMIIVLLNLIGISFTQAYWIFLGLYVFLGMTGFYFLLKVIFKEWIWAYLGCLMLLFSSFSLRVLDSNIFLIFVPIVWFFYFLTSFVRSQEKFSFLGMTFCLMMILTTYIPFYFLTILIWFLICFFIVYPKENFDLVRQSLIFIRGNKIFTIACLIALSFSCLPGYFLYREGHNKDLILPNRHDEGIASENRFTVGIARIEQGGVIPPVLLEEEFSRLKEFKAGMFYVPLVTFVILGLGLFNRVSRLTLAVVLFGFGIFLISLSDATNLHEFLYRHIFFFKYFRNWHFFLWIVLIPCICLICMDNLRALSRLRLEQLSLKLMGSVLVISVHGGFIWWLNQFDDVLWSSYLIVFLSSVFFICFFFQWFNCFDFYDRKGRIFKWCGLAFFVFLIIFQSCQVFYYFSKSSSVFQGYYRYQSSYQLWSIGTQGAKKYYDKLWQENLAPKTENIQTTRMYWGSVWANFLHQNLPQEIFDPYFGASFIAYDRVEKIDDLAVNINKVKANFGVLENVAFVPGFYEGPLASVELKDIPLHPEILTDQSTDFKLMTSNTNYLKIKTNFATPKFLVHNNSYNQDWRVFINRKPASLWRANIAFRGVWVPAGEQIIEFCFRSNGGYVLKFVILGIFYLVFFYLIKLSASHFIKANYSQ